MLAVFAIFAEYCWFSTLTQWNEWVYPSFICEATLSCAECFESNRTQRRWCLAQRDCSGHPQPTLQLWASHLCSCTVTPGTRIRVTKGVSQLCWHLLVHQNTTGCLDAFLPLHGALTGRNAKCYSSCHQLTAKKPKSAIFQKF